MLCKQDKIQTLINQSNLIAHLHVYLSIREIEIFIHIIY